MRLRHLSGFLLLCIAQTLFSQEPSLVVPTGHFGPIAGLRTNHSGSLVLTLAGGEEKSIKLWESESGRLLRTMEAHTAEVTSARFSENSKYIITTGKDQAGRVWDTETGTLVYNVPFEFSNWVQNGFFSRNNQYILLVADAVMEYHDLSSKKRISIVFDSVLLKNDEDRFQRETISSSDFHPDGKWAITTHADSTIRVWDLARNQILFRSKENAQLALASFSPSGKLFMASGSDGILRIWETATGKLISRLSVSPGLSVSAVFNKTEKWLLAASSSGKSLLFDIASGQKIREFNGHSGMVVLVQFSSDDKRIVSASLDGTAVLWDTETGKQLRTVAQTDLILNNGKKEIDENNFNYLHVSFSGDGQKLFSCLFSNKVTVQETQTGKWISTSVGINTLNLQPKYSPTGKWISSTGVESISPLRGNTKIWDAQTGKLAHLLRGHSGQVTDVVFHPNDKWVVTMADDSTAKLWDIANESVLATFSGHEKGVYKGYMSKDGRYLLTQTFAGTIRIWDIEENKNIAWIKHDSFTTQNYGVWNLELSPKGKYFKVLYYDDYRTEIRETATGKLLHRFHPKLKVSSFFRFDANDEKLYYAEDSAIHVLSLTTQQPLFSYSMGKQIAAMGIDPSGKYFAVGSNDNRIRIWDTDRFSLVKEIVHQKPSAHHIEFTKDGQYLVTSNYDTVTVWTLPGFAIHGQFKMPENEYVAFVLTRNNKHFLFCRSFESVLHVRELKTGATLAKINDKYNSSLDYIVDPVNENIIIDNKFSTDIYSASSSTPSLRIIPTSNLDYLSIDSAGHFDGTANARKLLYFTCGTEIIELEQVKDRLWVPNLAERILKKEKIETPGLRSVNICNITPVVRKIKEATDSYRYLITPRKGGLGETIVLVNGIEVKRTPKNKLMPSGTGFELKMNPAELETFFVAGASNTVEVKAMTAANDISSRGAILVANRSGNQRASSTPNLYALVVGVSDYKGEDLDLKYAAKDANDFANALRNSAAKLLNTDTANHVFVYKLHTGEDRDGFPEKNAVRQAVIDIGKKTQPNDILLIFFAGHGKWDQTKNQFFFLTAEASSFNATEGPAAAGISMQELSDWIQPSRMKAQKRILIFDACNSGQAIKDLVKIGNEDQKYTAARSDDKAQQIKSIEKLNNKSGLFILSASASNQSAYEMGRYAQGLLTYSLLKAIKEEPDILEEQKFLNVSRWFNAAEKTVSNLAAQNGNQQEPQLVSTTNFTIGLVDDEVRAAIRLPDAKPVFGACNFQNSDEAADGDDLELSKEVNRKLNDLAARGSNASLLFVAGTTASDAYSLTGRYDVKASEITVRVVIRQGKEIKSRFEVKGKQDKLDELASQIAEKAGSALQP